MIYPFIDPSDRDWWLQIKVPFDMIKTLVFRIYIYIVVVVF